MLVFNSYAISIVIALFLVVLRTAGSSIQTGLCIRNLLRTKIFLNSSTCSIILDHRRMTMAHNNHLAPALDFVDLFFLATIPNASSGFNEIRLARTLKDIDRHINAAVLSMYSEIQLKQNCLLSPTSDDVLVFSTWKAYCSVQYANASL